ncbi:MULTISPECIES: DUF3813 domain-containing protein [Heyndrickxia]|jgi:hypothetical protein|uniref:DUF3813 domain-containing protein n=1 Tax=Heyndrickxia coagulans TaxID=1398 RepID=A0A150K0U2_HEYCO|nr:MULTISPECIES: DUF3813 domain-containing protein [Heyndrickxia]AEH52868.1 conserved hypothetical protein [Heyndrickxia coagulans 2-6]KGT38380.1 hypothetical protein P421_10580 [Heyndrickxia coagulans P38]KYC63074.1 hypothetical protein B4098_0480 [Heyndrickxia coagulans]KYC63092.1 hypothetical protein B4100_0252 [Heyndrickxia coagulans]KYC66665.1 hypothetical protein B4099_0496 [Heyndrickxia coagulans]
MANRLFQEARQFVELAKETAAFGTEQEKNEMVQKAKNALSSAYANTTLAEKAQLRDMQQELGKLE